MTMQKAISVRLNNVDQDDRQHPDRVLAAVVDK